MFRTTDKPLCFSERVCKGSGNGSNGDEGENRSVDDLRRKLSSGFLFVFSLLLRLLKNVCTMRTIDSAASIDSYHNGPA